MTDLIYDLQRQVKNLEENPTPTGFMRNRSPFAYNVNDSETTYTANANVIGRENAIKNSLTAAQYDTLQKTTFASSTETVKEYIRILEKLVDEGVFDMGINHRFIFPSSYPNTNTISESEVPLKSKIGGYVVDEDVIKPKCDCKCNDCKGDCDDIAITPWAESKKSMEPAGVGYDKMKRISYDGQVIEIKFEKFEDARKVLSIIHDGLAGDEKYVNQSISLIDDEDTGEHGMSLNINDLENYEIAKFVGILTAAICQYKVMNKKK